MKRSIMLALSLTTLLAACNDDKANQEGASKIQSDSETKAVKHTTKKENKNNTQTTKKSVDHKSTDIMSEDFHQMYMFNDHRFAVDKIKFGMTRDEVEAIYGASLGKGDDLYGLKTTALYDVYGVTYDNLNKVRQIVINPNRKISKAEFLKVYSNPTTEDGPGNTLEYNDNNNNGYKIRASFDDNDNLIGIAQVNDQKGMQETNGKTDGNFMEKQDAFEKAMFDYAEKNNLAATGRYLIHGGGINTDIFVPTEDGLMLAQAMLNPGVIVHDIEVKGGVVVYQAKDGTTGEQTAAMDTSNVEGIEGFMKPGTETIVYLLANNGKVYEYKTTGGDKVNDYFSIYSESWGFDLSNMTILKATTNPEIKKIAEQIMSGQEVEQTSDQTENETRKSDYSFIDENGEIDIRDPKFKDYFFHEAHTDDFAGIKVGMTREEVEALYGPITEDAGYDMHQGGLDKVGDISLNIGQDDRVKSIYITPGEIMTEDESNATYGKPTEINDDTYLGPVYVYNTNKNNRFQVIIGFAGEDVPIFVNRPEGEIIN
ncbi:hypothetical protein ACMGE7_02215 [Macrococcus equi]|uniref:hypothetical protein n=1 Tax=Macrococcus equi TaxID=3395462 RepID=UPI0039BEB0F3